MTRDEILAAINEEIGIKNVMDVLMIRSPELYDALTTALVLAFILGALRREKRP